MIHSIKTPSQLRPLLVAYRKALGGQKEMAALLGVTQQTYAAMEARPESASFERLHRVLSLLGVSVALVVPDAQPSPAPGVADTLEPATPRPDRDANALVKQRKTHQPKAASVVNDSAPEGAKMAPGQTRRKGGW